jgi:hypothetical protein
VAVIIIVSLGQLPGRLARKWNHPQAAAVNVAGWLGVATGGLIWPLALIWAFMIPSERSPPKIDQDQQARGVVEPDGLTKQDVPKFPADKENRP